MSKHKIIKGGEFLIRETAAKDIFIPVEFDEEQRMIAQSSQDFIAQEVLPKLDEIDEMQEGLMTAVLTKPGERGLCGISIHDQYGGFGTDFVTAMVATQRTPAGYSFAVAPSAHTRIRTLPSLYYDTDAQ